MTGGGDGGRGLSNFFGFEILGKSDFIGSMKDTEIFLGRGKKTNRGIFGVVKKGQRDCFGYTEKSSDFFG